MADKREIELVTVEKAQVYVDTTKNVKGLRPIDWTRVKGYSHEMTAGRWKYNGIPFCFTKAGVMFNGRHRSLALIDCGKPQLFAMERGLDDDVFETIDVGKSRSIKDIFHMKGYMYPHVAGVAARNIFAFQTYDTFTPANFITPGDRLETASDNAELQKLVVAYASHRYALNVSPATLASIHYVLRQHAKSKTTVDEFMGPFVTGENLVKGDPRLVLRDFIIRRPLSVRSMGAKTGELATPKNFSVWVMNQMLEAWNNWRAGNQITKIINLKGTPVISK